MSLVCQNVSFGCCVAGTSPPVVTVPIAGPPMYLRPSDPYINGPPPTGPYGAPPMSSNYHQMQPQTSFQRSPDVRFQRTIPMTTYQQHPRTHPMQNQQLTNRNSHGQPLRLRHCLNLLFRTRNDVRWFRSSKTHLEMHCAFHGWFEDWTGSAMEK